MIIKRESFSNGDSCWGQSFNASGAPLDLAEIVIDGRYPKTGWARNKESHEIVRVLSGLGSLAFRSGEMVRLEEGVVAHVPPDEWFAWQSEGGEELKLLMACSPPFSSEQYELEEEDDEI